MARSSIREKGEEKNSNFDLTRYHLMAGPKREGPMTFLGTLPAVELVVAVASAAVASAAAAVALVVLLKVVALFVLDFDVFWANALDWDAPTVAIVAAAVNAAALPASSLLR